MNQDLPNVIAALVALVLALLALRLAQPILDKLGRLIALLLKGAVWALAGAVCVTVAAAVVVTIVCVAIGDLGYRRQSIPADIRARGW